MLQLVFVLPNCWLNLSGNCSCVLWRLTSIPFIFVGAEINHTNMLKSENQFDYVSINYVHDIGDKIIKRALYFLCK